MRLFNTPHLLAAACLVFAVGCKQKGLPVLETTTGLAAFYSSSLDGSETTSGRIFYNHDMVAAHSTYPFGTLVRVTSLTSKETVEVTIIDNLPVKGNREKGVIIDVSHAAAAKLRMLDAGNVRVRVEVLEWGKKERKQR